MALTDARRRDSRRVEDRIWGLILRAGRLGDREWTVPRIQRALGMPRGTVRQALDRLIEKGAVERRGREYVWKMVASIE